MIRLSEEQRAILSCYSGAKKEVTKEMMIGVPFVTDLELKEMLQDLLVRLEKMNDAEYKEVSSMIDVFNGKES